MAIPVSTNFNLGAALPLDARTVVDSYDDLSNIEAAYAGLRVWVKGEKKYYRYTGSAWESDDKTGGYEVGGTGENGEVWGYIPIVKSDDGGIELGQYIDFHLTSNDGIDRAARIRIYDDNGVPRFKLEGATSDSTAHLTVQNITASQYHGTYYGTMGYPLKVTLNGTEYTYNGNSANATACATGLVFYAPTAAGTAGYLLLADDDGKPTWTNVLPYDTKFYTGEDSSTTLGLAAFYSAFTNAVNTLTSAITSGDKSTLASAQEYADEVVLAAAKAYANEIVASATPYQSTVSSQADFQEILVAQEWKKGWCWKVATAMSARTLYYTAPALEIGDLILAEADAPGIEGMTVYSDSAVVVSNYFTVIQANLEGAVITGSANSSTAKNLAIFSDATGQVIRDSGIGIDDLATANDVTYTNENGTTAAVGGIASGTTFENESVISILENLLYPMAITFKATANGAGTYEKGTTKSPTFTITVTQGASEVDSVGIYNSSNTLVSSTATATAGTQTGVTLTTALSATTTLKAIASGGKQSVTSSTLTWTFIDPMYYGAVSEAPTTSAGVRALTKLVKSKAAQTVSFTTTSDAGKYCFAYPASYDELSSILDGNGFDNTSDFTCDTENPVTVTTTAGESVSYYVYTYNNTVTAGTMSFTFKW